MVTIYSIRKNTLSEDDLLQVELRGLSDDDKPISLANGLIDNGSVFIEIDTGDVYLYNMDDKEWVPIADSEETTVESEEVPEQNESR